MMQYYSADVPANFKWHNENLSNQFMTYDHDNDVIVIEDDQVVDTISVDLPSNFRRNVQEPDYLLKDGNNVSLDDFTLGIQHHETSLNQLVPYNNDNDVKVIEDCEVINTPSYEMSSLPVIPTPNHSMKVLPSVGTYAIQCASCMKWRIVPSKGKYEELRENIMSNPFYCEKAQEWNADVSCADPPDILQDDSKLWAIDKPNIAKPPPGWERTLRIRAEGGTKFADVYYAAPTGKMLRSMAEIQKYLLKHPEFTGISMSQFSFKAARPLQENYVRKRSVGSINANRKRLGGIQANLHPMLLVGPDPNREIPEQGTPSTPKKKTKKKKSTTSIEKSIMAQSSSQWNSLMIHSRYNNEEEEEENCQAFQQRCAG